MPRQPPTAALPEVEIFDTLVGPSTTSPFLDAGKVLVNGPLTAPNVASLMNNGTWDEQECSADMQLLQQMPNHKSSQTSPQQNDACTSPALPPELAKAVTAPATVSWQQAAEESSNRWGQYDEGLLGNANSLGDLLSMPNAFDPARAPVTAPALAYSPAYSVSSEGTDLHAAWNRVPAATISPVVRGLPMFAPYYGMPFVVAHAGLPRSKSTEPGSPAAATPTAGRPQPTSGPSCIKKTVKLAGVDDGPPGFKTAKVGNADACGHDSESSGDGDEAKGKRRRRRRRRHRGRGRRGRGKGKKEASEAAGAADHTDMPAMCSGSDSASDEEGSECSGPE